MKPTWFLRQLSTVDDWRIDALVGSFVASGVSYDELMMGLRI